MNGLDNKQLEAFTVFLGDTLGKMYETILFDLSDVDLSVLASVNMDEKIIPYARDFLREAVKTKYAMEHNCYTNHAMITMQQNIDKISAYFIKDETNRFAYGLVVIMHCSPIMKIDTILQSLLNINTGELLRSDSLADEQRNSLKDPIEMSLNRISEYVEEYGIQPGKATYDEKAEIICDLYDMGLFDIKGSVARVAEELGISDKSVYRYLARIKNART